MRRVSLLFISALVVLTLSHCGSSSDGGPTGPVIITIEPGTALLTAVGATQTFTTAVPDDGSSVQWSSSSPNIASIHPASGLATAEEEGVTRITATVDGVSATARLEVFFDPTTGPFTAGSTFFGRNDYVEYHAGDLPVIFSAPHGGTLTPEEIPDRTFGTLVRDTNTEEVARALLDSIHARTGRYPHVIISRLRRTKLDPNREIVEAAQGNIFAEQAWREFQGFIEAARETVAADWGRGFYMDLHGHGHEIQRLELGYLLSSSDLALPDETLRLPSLVEKSSVRTLARDAPGGLPELLRGNTALGTLLDERGFPSVPSLTDPAPGGAPYFTGGFNTRSHGSRDGGSVSGVQIEMNFDGVRDTEEARAQFAGALTDALEVFLLEHYGVDWRN